MSNNRQRQYKLLAVANREMQKTRAGWCEDDHRLILMQCGAKLEKGRYSATSMTIGQLYQAMERYKALGFRVKKKGSSDWRAPRIAKLNAIWCEMADVGIVRDRSQRAMERFCKGQVKGMTHLRWASSEQLNQCVEILKKWHQRIGTESRG